MTKKEFQNLKKILKQLCKNNLFLFLSISVITFVMFVYLEFALRYVIRTYFSLYSLVNFSPVLFTISIFILFIIVFLLLSKRGKRIFFNVYWIIFYLFFLAQFFHFKILKVAFSLTDIGLAKEATAFADSVLSQIKWELILTTILFVIGMVLSNMILKRMELKRPDKKIFLIFIGCFILFRILAFVSLGEKIDDGKYRTMITPKNIYTEYSDTTRALTVSGMPEFMWRFIYMDIKKKLNEPSKKQLRKEANEYIKETPYKHTNNRYTGVFKDKNVIYIMLESIDEFLVTNEVMPTLYKLKNEGLNFTNRYAPTFSGGKTFNTEFSMLTGMYQPSQSSAAFKYKDNTFIYTFPNMFKKQGYVSNSIHYNNGNYYNRENMHESIGFTEHYDNLNKKYKKNFKYDTNLVNTEETYQIIAPDNTKFASMVTTMSGHLPYKRAGYACEEFLEKYPQYTIPEDPETSCLNAKAHETDEFIRLLIERLKKDKKLNNTVLVFVTDHEAYGYSQLQEVKKERDANLISHVPFIIWNNKIDSYAETSIMDTSDILPTISNLFSLDYKPVFSLGTDVFSKEHEGFTFFENGSWYDGNIYYQNDDRGYSKKELKYINEITQQVQNKIRMNKVILDSDYYEKYNKLKK